MKTELEKCMGGEWYDCHDPVFVEFKTKARELLVQYNTIPYDSKKISMNFPSLTILI